ncbi:MAG: hypothetical protein ACR650_15540 [Methylocystis sp.]
MKSFALTIAGAIALTVLGLGASAMAEDDVCRWGGDNGESLKCFDCQRLVLVGREWRWVNTCKSQPYAVIPGYERN